MRGLVGRGREYTEDHKEELRAIELELLNAVVPAYRNAIESGRVEVSTSPFYHPILPLLCDSDIFKHTHPGSRMPRSRDHRRAGGEGVQACPGHGAQVGGSARGIRPDRVVKVDNVRPESGLYPAH